jgi:phosphonate transport system permease protein
VKSEAVSSTALRDPAALPRLVLIVTFLLLLWPGLTLTEFNPGVLFDSRNRETIGKFLATFFPLDVSADFLRLVFKSTLETLAIATAGMAIALAIALPLSLMVTRSLSISRIRPCPAGGRAACCAPLPALY